MEGEKQQPSILNALRTVSVHFFQSEPDNLVKGICGDLRICTSVTHNIDIDHDDPGIEHEAFRRLCRASIDGIRCRHVAGRFAP